MGVEEVEDVAVEEVGAEVEDVVVDADVGEDVDVAEEDEVAVEGIMDVIDEEMMIAGMAAEEIEAEADMDGMIDPDILVKEKPDDILDRDHVVGIMIEEEIMIEGVHALEIEIIDQIASEEIDLHHGIVLESKNLEEDEEVFQEAHLLKEKEGAVPFLVDYDKFTMNIVFVTTHICDFVFQQTHKQKNHSSCTFLLFSDDQKFYSKLSNKYAAF